VNKIDGQDENTALAEFARMGMGEPFFISSSHGRGVTQMIEDIFRFLFTPLRYFAFQYRLIGIFQNISRFSCDEMSTIYHFPDIKYNKSPIISWLDYKMLAPPSNLKFPKEPLIMKDYKRDKDGNIFTQDGSLLKVDKNKNLFRDENKDLQTVGGMKITVHKEGDKI
jgi:hypothetical protein